MILAGLAALAGGCGNAVNGDVTATREGGSTVNGAIRVPAGQQVGPVSTVNGSITIENGATAGAARAVNGEIKVDTHATVESAASVNGSVILGDSAHVKADVKSVNGEIELQKDSEVSGSVSTVDGAISLTDARVGGGLRTVAANIDIMGSSHVDGGILVEKNTGVDVSDHLDLQAANCHWPGGRRTGRADLQARGTALRQRQGQHRPGRRGDGGGLLRRQAAGLALALQYRTAVPVPRGDTARRCDLAERLIHGALCGFQQFIDRRPDGPG